jgi:hypothetical protein
MFKGHGGTGKSYIQLDYLNNPAGNLKEYQKYFNKRNLI